jgi:hypothetical protein
MTTTGPRDPAYGGFTITEADTDLATNARFFYVGVGGTVKITTVDGNVLTLVGIPAGTFVPISVKRIWLTGTVTATSFVGFL